MALALRKEDTRVWTYRDYYNMPDDGNRYEIIDGELFMMAAPTHKHQAILMELSNRLYIYLRGKPCIVRFAPLDVRLALYGEKKGEEINVVQPDIMVFCSRNQVDEKGGVAAPDFVAEILSPSTKKMDRQRKLKLYEKTGVKEYWIIDGENETVEVYVHDGTKFGPKTYYNMNSTITCAIFNDFEVKVSDIIVEPIPWLQE